MARIFTALSVFTVALILGNWGTGISTLATTSSLLFEDLSLLSPERTTESSEKEASVFEVFSAQIKDKFLSGVLYLSVKPVPVKDHR